MANTGTSTAMCSADGGDRGVDEHHRGPAIELGHELVEPGVAQVAAVVVRGEQDDAVCTKHVERVGGFVEGAVNVGQRHRGERPNRVGLAPTVSADGFVASPGEVAGLGVVTEVHTGS